ncbi:hypothetical protein [Massilia sp. GCM10023247]|uniref:hypothetical protein n=1 Tax=Massilia sp. GCM10023247 TaxID=3252643 RepID=UPI0036191D40
MRKQDMAALACWLAAVGALFFILRAGHPVQAHLVHADALYLPVLFDDLLRNGGRFSDWFLTPAPYFFPDMPMYGLAWLASDSVLGQTTGFALLQTALAALALYFLARQLLARGALPAAATLSILFVWLGLTVDDPFVRLFTSAHHYGAFLAALLLCALWLGREGVPQAGRNRLTDASIAVLGFLTTLSDSIFLVQTTIPLLATALLFGRGALRATAWRATLLLLLPALAGMLSYRFVVTHQTRLPARLSLSRLPENLGELGHILATLLGGRPLLAAALLLSLGVGAACILACLRRRPLPGLPGTLPRPLLMLAAFATLSCLATVSVMLLSKTLIPVPRYLIGAASLPLVAGVFVLVHLLDARSPRAAPALCLAVCLVLSGLLAGQAWRVREVRDTDRYYYPEPVACVDRALAAARARHGIAQYWDAKLLQGLSRQRLTLAQYSGDLSRMEWITSERFYRPHYDFAIIADAEAAQFKLPRERLAALGGELPRAVACGDRTVLLFRPAGLRAPEAAAPRAAPVPSRFAAPGASFRWKGCELPSGIGKPAAACGVEKRDPRLSGHLTYGPYEPLPAGEYALQIRYASAEGETGVVGAWDVALQLPGEVVVANAGQLTGTRALPARMSAWFSIAPAHAMAPVEIRTTAHEGKSLRVDSIELTRLR